MSTAPVSVVPIGLLLVSEEEPEAERLCGMLATSELQAFDVRRAGGVDAALEMLRDGRFDAVLLLLPPGVGLEPLMRARVAATDTPIVLVAFEGTEQNALEAMRAGAQEYLLVEECSPRLLARTVSHAVERHRIRGELLAARRKDRYFATHDPLTELPNREAFIDQLTGVLEGAERGGGHPALLFVDLDHFKSINDSLGHAAGDRLLRFVAQRLSMVARPNDLVARFAGDEFVLCLRAVDEIEASAAVAHTLLQVLSEPYLIHGHESWVTASIGVAVFPVDGRNPDELLRNSDMAMYRAKIGGRNNFQFCTEAMNAAAERRLLIRERLARALDQDRLEVEYQPIRDRKSGRVSACEALVRWKDPEASDVSPEEFIPVAEDSGLIVRIGEWVLRQACQQARAWQVQGFGSIRLSVNVSSRQLQQHTLVETIREILEKSNLSAGSLELEITERSLLGSDGFTGRALRELRDMGIGLALDDFGTGHSALGYLRHFRFDRVKIDRSFVHGIADDPDAPALTRAIVAMAGSLGIATVAEGVEREEDLAVLTACGCDEVQGYLTGAPMGAEALSQLLEREKDDA